MAPALPVELFDNIVAWIAVNDAHIATHGLEASDASVVDTNPSKGRRYLSGMETVHLVSRAFHQATLSYLWHEVDLSERSITSIRFFLYRILPSVSKHVRVLHLAHIHTPWASSYRNSPLEAVHLTLKQARVECPQLAARWEGDEITCSFHSRGEPKTVTYSYHEEAREERLNSSLRWASPGTQRDWRSGGYDADDWVNNNEYPARPGERFGRTELAMDNRKRLQLHDAILSLVQVVDLQYIDLSDPSDHIQLEGIRPPPFRQLLPPVVLASTSLRRLAVRLDPEDDQDPLAPNAFGELFTSGDNVLPFVEAVTLAGVGLTQAALIHLVGKVRSLSLLNCDIEAFPAREHALPCQSAVEKLNLVGTLDFGRIERLIELCDESLVQLRIHRTGSPLYLPLHQFTSEAKIARLRELSVEGPLHADFHELFTASPIHAASLHSIQLSGAFAMTFLEAHDATLKFLVIDIIKFSFGQLQELVDRCSAKGIKIVRRPYQQTGTDAANGFELPSVATWTKEQDGFHLPLHWSDGSSGSEEEDDNDVGDGGGEDDISDASMESW